MVSVDAKIPTDRNFDEAHFRANNNPLINIQLVVITVWAKWKLELGLIFHVFILEKN